MTAAVQPARLKTQYLVQVKNQALQNQISWTESVSLTTQAKMELQWWIDSLQSWNGLTWIRKPPQEEIYTDASETGWGIVHQQNALSGTWDKATSHCHINLKELMVIWKVVTLPRFQGQRLHIYCDNTTTIAYINRFGGTRSPELMKLANKIWNHCLATGTTITTSFVPTIFNPADPPSRQMESQLEWSINKQCFQKIDQLWGPHNIDLFATHKNRQLPKYMSWKYEPQAFAQNALLQSWKKLGRLYICPPWNLIPKILSQLQQQRCPATLITPNWTSAIWYPILKSLAKQLPLKLHPSVVQPANSKDKGIMKKNLSWCLLAWNI